MPSVLEAAKERLMAKTMRQWLQDSLYLPKRLRDFHDQKDVFKLVWDQVLKAQAGAELRGEPVPFKGEFSWVMAHCYVIDQFLWFMARHGWTLQRVKPREGFKFEDLDAAVAAYKEAQAAAFREMLTKRKEDGGGQATT